MDLTSMILTKGQFSFSELGSKMAFFVIFQQLIIYFNKGDHGFDNDLEDMKTIFRAFGPNFKKNHLAEPFDSIHIYPLMCKLLGVTPEPHNGSLAVTQEMLVDSFDQRPGEMQKQSPENWQLLPVLRKNRFIMGSPGEGMKSSRIILFPSSFSTPGTRYQQLQKDSRGGRQPLDVLVTFYIVLQGAKRWLSI